MNVIKQAYTAPALEEISLSQPLNLLVSLSVEADLEDFEEGEYL